MIKEKKFSELYLEYGDGCMLSRFSYVRVFATLRNCNQAPLSTGLPRQEYGSGLPCPPPGKSSWSRDWTWESLTSSALAGGFFTTNTTWEACGDGYTDVSICQNFWTRFIKYKQNLNKVDLKKFFKTKKFNYISIKHSCSTKVIGKLTGVW